MEQVHSLSSQDGQQNEHSKPDKGEGVRKRKGSFGHTKLESNSDNEVKEKDYTDEQLSAVKRFAFTLYHTITTLWALYKRPFENIVGKGENAGNQHFLLFPQCFLPFTK